jgi:hypothetical protein
MPNSNNPSQGDLFVPVNEILYPELHRKDYFEIAQFIKKNWNKGKKLRPETMRKKSRVNKVLTLVSEI